MGHVLLIFLLWDLSGADVQSRRLEEVELSCPRPVVLLILHLHTHRREIMNGRLTLEDTRDAAYECSSGPPLTYQLLDNLVGYAGASLML